MLKSFIAFTYPRIRLLHYRSLVKIRFSHKGSTNIKKFEDQWYKKNAVQCCIIPTLQCCLILHMHAYTHNNITYAQMSIYKN